MKVKLDKCEVWSDGDEAPRNFFEVDEQDVLMYACDPGDEQDFVIELPRVDSDEDDFTLLIYLDQDELARAVGVCLADRAMG
jgi:hypothetical protein